MRILISCYKQKLFLWFCSGRVESGRDILFHFEPGVSGEVVSYLYISADVVAWCRA
jgi:hypothetical protein